MTETIVPSSPPRELATKRPSRVGPVVARTLLRKLRGGTLIVSDPRGERRYGAGRPEVRLSVFNDRAYGATLARGSRGFGQSYVAGWWECDDLTGLVRILLRSLAPLGARLDRAARFVAPLRDAIGARRYRERPGDDVRARERDRAQVRAHYDLSNDFFELMLDETMMYSCALFAEPTTDLADASRAKLDAIGRSINLSADDHVVEIGTGWGGFAIYAAREFGCRVTTTTISTAQYEYARRRVREAGLEHLVDVRNEDYRDLRGAFDKLVSIEMVEAIGWRELDNFFRTCAGLIPPSGLMALQAIVINDGSYERAKYHEDFIKDQIFPGGFLPSVQALTGAARRSGELTAVSLVNVGAHYGETLRRWRDNVRKNRDGVSALGLGEGFLRLWNLYLSYCEGAFEERHISVVQMVFARER